MPYSIEKFFSDAEVQRVLCLIDQYKAAHPDKLAAGSTGRSVHHSDFMSLEDLVAMYEPQGRIDINMPDLPPEIVEIMEDAYFRHIEDIRRPYPGATWPYSITYVEYGRGQFFTPHADGITSLQCAGFGVTLTDQFSGGEFCVETCGSNRFWTTGSDGLPNVAPAADSGSAWFRGLPRTQWSMRPKKGTAVFYGSALVHSSKPVTSGSLKKLLAFITNA
jgi:hypothetical protein